IAVLLAFILGKIEKEKLIIYFSWLATSFIFMMPFSTRYTFKNLVMSTSTGLAIGIFIIIFISLLVMKNDKLKNLREKTKLPKELFYVIVSVIILIVLISVFLGHSFVFDQISGITNSLITPMTTRFGLTVAENKQPYYEGEWEGSFGPIKFNIPLFFWLFFIGSVVLFNNLIKSLNKKERIILTFSYIIFLMSLIFSRYSPSSILNGVNGLSLLIYFGGVLIFIGSACYIYYKTYNEGKFSEFKKFSFSYILYFIILTLGIVGARGGIRLIMVLGAISPIAVAFLIVKSSKKYLDEKEDMAKFFFGIFAVIILVSSLFTFWAYYESDKATAENFAPGIYQWQWQNAMSWVRENTSEDAVFAHWWDYGYWVQSIGERSTILDGGNAIVYWNHLMGRYVLTGDDEQKALEFLYAHNGTHLLIDSTEIGKYTAYSSIGADENYDRFSWISTFLLDEKQTQETNNETIYIYPGGTVLDEDMIIEENGKEIFLPKKNAGIGAIILRKNAEGNFLQPEAILVYNGKQYYKKLRFAYIDGELKDFDSGLDSGIFVFPRVEQNGINKIGALLYLSKRTVHSRLAQLYLFDQKSDYFKLTHVESSFIVENLRQQGLEVGEIIYYQGIQGPIKIWEISYPKNIEVNPDYLLTDFPDQEINIAKTGEY
ncbi:MAG: hypothetical protein AABX88_00725, partial [Nanoarchaeota archaeon]